MDQIKIGKLLSFFDKKIDLPATIRWSNSEDAEGLEITLSIQKNPHFAEIYFNEALKPLNLIIEFDGYWFYKAPGVKCLDLMTYFFENPKKKGNFKLRIFSSLSFSFCRKRFYF